MLVGALCLLLVWLPHALAIQEAGDRDAVISRLNVTSRTHAVGDIQPNTWRGDLTALGTGMTLGAVLTVSRYLPQKDAAHVVPLMNACGCLVLAAGAACMTGPGGAMAHADILFWVPTLLNGIGDGISWISSTLATRHVVVTVVSIILQFEGAFGSLWVWLAFGEAPSAFTVAAYGLQASALLVHELLELREARSTPTK